MRRRDARPCVPSLWVPEAKVHAPQMEEVHTRLVGSGATIGLRPESWEYGAGETMKFMMFHDPDGNYLGLIEVLTER